MFSYLSPEELRDLQTIHCGRFVLMVGEATLKSLLSRRSGDSTRPSGRPSIPPEQLLRALLLHVVAIRFAANEG